MWTKDKKKKMTILKDFLFTHVNQHYSFLLVLSMFVQNDQLCLVFDEMGKLFGPLY